MMDSMCFFCKSLTVNDKTSGENRYNQQRIGGRYIFPLLLISHIFFIFTARKRSCEGYIFTGVCLSTGGSGLPFKGCLSRGSLSRRVSAPRALCLGGSLSREVSVQGVSVRVCQGDPRTVKSGLQECILVIILNWYIPDLTYQYLTGILVVARCIQNSHHLGRRSHQSHHQRQRIHGSEFGHWKQNRQRNEINRAVRQWSMSSYNCHVIKIVVCPCKIWTVAFILSDFFKYLQ